MLQVSNFEKDGKEKVCMLCGSNCSKKFSFCTGRGSSELSFRAIRDNAIVQEESIASCRMAMAKVVRLSIINRTNELPGLSGTWKLGRLTSWVDESGKGQSVIGRQ